MASLNEWRTCTIFSAAFLAVLPLNIVVAAESYEQTPSVTQDAQAATATTQDGTSAGQRHVLLQGSVSVDEESTAVGNHIDALLDDALARDPKTAFLDSAVQHYRTKGSRFLAQTKDAADFAFCTGGFGPSCEAADVITGEKVKIKSRASAEYARQKHIDEFHYRIVSSVMEIAMGLGMSNSAQGHETVGHGLDSLQALVGGDEAARTMQMLSSLNQRVRVPDAIFHQRVWDVQRRNEMSSTMVKTALARDPVVVEILKHLHRYNHRGQVYQYSGQVCETVFGVLSRTPAVEQTGLAALVAFVTATGGPEQAKIMKELYLDRRFASRLQVISEETHMAVDNYQVAVLTRNPALLVCSESIVQHLAGPDTVAQLFGRSVLPKGSASVTAIQAPAMPTSPAQPEEGARVVTAPSQKRSPASGLCSMVGRGFLKLKNAIAGQNRNSNFAKTGNRQKTCLKDYYDRGVADGYARARQDGLGRGAPNSYGRGRASGYARKAANGSGTAGRRYNYARRPGENRFGSRQHVAAHRGSQNGSSRTSLAHHGSGKTIASRQPVGKPKLRRANSRLVDADKGSRTKRKIASQSAL